MLEPNKHIPLYYLSGGSIEKDGSYDNFRKIVAEQQKVSGLPNEPVQPETSRVTFPPVFSNTTFISGIVPTEIDVIAATKKEISAENKNIYVRWHDLKLLPVGLDFICGFVDHESYDLQRWREI